MLVGVCGLALDGRFLSFVRHGFLGLDRFKFAWSCWIGFSRCFGEFWGSQRRKIEPETSSAVLLSFEVGFFGFLLLYLLIDQHELNQSREDRTPWLHLSH